MIQFLKKRYVYWLLFALKVATVNAQQIIPKTAPFVRLSASGGYGVNLSDICTITGNPTFTYFTPKNFDCQATLQPQLVYVAISDQNGHNVSFDNPGGMVIDAAGNLYVADMAGNVIRKITPAGVVTTFAGNGDKGSVNGSATEASFNSPTCLAIDPDNNIYVTDMNNHMIRKISYDGMVSTLAGSGGAGSLDGPGNAASFYLPAGIAVDNAGNLIVVDEGNDNIRKIDPDGMVSTIAGGGVPGYADGQGLAAKFTLPWGVVLDPAGNMYVTDIQNYRIRKITPAGMVSTLAGNGKRQTVDGTGTSASFYVTYGISIDAKDNLFVGDQGCIRKVTPQGVVTTVAGGFEDDFTLDGTGNKAVAGNQLTSIVPDASGNMYFTDTYHNIIRELTPDGAIITLMGDGTAAVKNGTVGNLATINNRQKYITVNVGTYLAFAAKLADVTDNFLGCPPVLLAFHAKLAENTCDTTKYPQRPYPNSYSYHISQTPAAGTPVTNNVPVQVKLVLYDQVARLDSMTFMFTGFNGSTNNPSSVTVDGPPGGVCASAAVTFYPKVVNPLPSPSYAWYVNGHLESGSETLTTSSLKNGDTVYCIENSGNPQCLVPVMSNLYIANVVAPPSITFTQKPFIEPGSSVQLNPVISLDNSQIVKYRWSPASWISDSTIRQPVVSPLTNTTYTLEITAESGCTATQSILVKVDPSLNAPTAFTPNGDGVNDLWQIKVLQAYPQCTVNIFNRNGQRVFYSKGFSGWDGTYNGKALADGTYYYIIKTLPGNPTYSGSVTIIR